MTLSHYASCCDHTLYCLYIRVIIQNPKWIRYNRLTVPYLSIFTYMEPNPLRKSSTPSLKAVQNVRHGFKCQPTLHERTQRRNRPLPHSTNSCIAAPSALSHCQIYCCTNCYITGGTGCITEQIVASQDSDFVHRSVLSLTAPNWKLQLCLIPASRSEVSSVASVRFICYVIEARLETKARFPSKSSTRYKTLFWRKSANAN